MATYHLLSASSARSAHLHAINVPDHRTRTAALAVSDLCQSAASAKYCTVLIFIRPSFFATIWSRYLGNVSREMQADVDVLKDTLMSREDKQRCIFTRDEIETVIRVICTELCLFL